MNFMFKQKGLEQDFYKLEITGNFRRFEAISFLVCYILGYLHFSLSLEVHS